MKIEQQQHSDLGRLCKHACMMHKRSDAHLHLGGAREHRTGRGRTTTVEGVLVIRRLASELRGSCTHHCLSGYGIEATTEGPQSTARFVRVQARVAGSGGPQPSCST